ncbi:MAG: trypsin-like peptidase domain-containing protein [Myxococcota bacterium]
MSEPRTIPDIIDAVSPSIVEVFSRRSRASGVIYDQHEGLILTTLQALSRRSRLTVRLADGTSSHARLRGIERGADLALIQVDDINLPAPPPWQDAAPRVGETVLTIGREPESARVTRGLVSAVRGPWRTRGGIDVQRWVEIDASLPAVSAGGLSVNLHGEAIGFNSRRLTRIGAALPPLTVRRLAERLRDQGTRQRGYLGVGVQVIPLSPPIERHAAGMLVNAVDPDSPAGRAGILIGDVLLSLDDEPLDVSRALIDALSGRVDVAATLTLLRAGQVQTIQVTPSTRKRARHAEE